MTTGRNTQVAIAGFSLVLAVNAIVLGSVAWNRSGTPDSVLELGERELVLLPYSQTGRDDSGLGLGIRWRIPIADADPEERLLRYGGMAPAWLDERKLIELGFDLSQREPDDHSSLRDRREKEVVLVLEFDGPEYRKSLERAQRQATRDQQKLAALESLASVETGTEILHEARQRAESSRQAAEHAEFRESRLFIVDAGLDHKTLRTAYPDRSRYALVRGLIRPLVQDDRVGGWISGLSTGRVNVPLRWRWIFEPLLRAPWRGSGGEDKITPYRVTLAHGRKLEPWVAAIHGPQPVVE